jgi:hypothetical protein
VAAGLGVAAGGLALAGQAILDLAPAAATVFLVVMPLLGCFPVAFAAQAARTRPTVAKHLPAGLVIWLLAAAATTGWFGIRPLVM